MTARVTAIFLMVILIPICSFGATGEGDTGYIILFFGSICSQQKFSETVST